MVTKEYIYRLMIRLFDDEQLQDKEYADVKNWLQDHPEDKTYFIDLYKAHVNIESDRQVNDELIHQQWEHFTHDVINKPKSFKSTKRFIPWNQISRYAAVFILGMFLSSGLFWAYQHVVRPNLFSQVIEVPFGGKSNVFLADGTEVLLNAGSQLKYNPSFGNRKREVIIEGEAFFKVATNPNMPFVVKTSDLVVKAYGTEFNVKAYADEKVIETTLIEGSISVQKNSSQSGKEFFLKPNEKITYHKAVNTAARHKKEQLFISRNIDVNLSTAWIDDRINVKSELLSELVIRLQRKYNVQIHYDEVELGSLRFSGILENETIEQVMKAIQLTAPINFEIKNRDIWLTKRAKIQNSILTN